MKNYEGRLVELRRKLNLHLAKLTGSELDFYANLTQEHLIELKSAIADMNNILTFKTTIAAAEWLCTHFYLDDIITQEVMNNIDVAKPNSNGYDIHIRTPAIVAEVKAIAPVNNGSKFGAAQSQSLIKDIKNLTVGKKSIPDTSFYIKILFVLDLGRRTDSAINTLMKSKDFYTTLNEHNIEVCLLDIVPNVMETNKVYIKRVLI